MSKDAACRISFGPAPGNDNGEAPAPLSGMTTEMILRLIRMRERELEYMQAELRTRASLRLSGRN